MKKISLLILAFIFAFLLSELFIRYVIQYPYYGLSYKVHYRRGGDYWTNIWKPYTKYWNVESGNHIFTRNNLGLPGSDVSLNSPQKIAVLGSSYVEALQVKPKNIATSIFQEQLKKRFADIAVFNLGCSGHDPYDSWFRLLYFKKRINFQKVILILEKDYTDWFSRHPKPFCFQPDNQFGTINNSKTVKLQTLLRNNFSYFALLANGTKGKTNNSEKEIPNSANKNTLEVSQELLSCLKQFDSIYENDFILISITEDQDFNHDLDTLCRQNGINYISCPLLDKELQLHGNGHLNELGNQRLGQALINTYLKFYPD